MTAKNEESANGIARSAGPWAAGWSGIHRNSPSNAAREPSNFDECEELARVHALPKGALRRIQTIGFAASGVAGTLWLLTMVWVWQIIA